MNTAAALEQRALRAERASRRLREFVALTKPRVVSLIVFTAVIGMFLAAPGMVVLPQAFFGAFAVALGAAGLATLHALVNPLTMWLTLATFAGYAIVYTLLLKPHTPHNIVLGGAAGAMPPVTHGMRATRRQILLYTLGLFAVSVLPFCTGMSGRIYLVSALLLGSIFVAYAVALYRSYSDKLAHATFRYSIAYLALLFAALLADHSL